MTKGGSYKLVALLIATLLALPLGTLTAGASAKKSDAFDLSGQAKGTLTLNHSETCAGGNISTSDGWTTVRIYLTDHSIKPTKDLWYLLLDVKGLKASFPASNADQTLALGANDGASIAEQWNAGVKLGSGTVTFAKGFKSGSMSVSLAPAPDQKGATSDEKIVGSWSC